MSKDQLEASTKTLEDTNRVAIETEEIALGTLSELRKQREQMSKTRSKLDTLDSEVYQTSNTIDSMNNKCCIS